MGLGIFSKLFVNWSLAIIVNLLFSTMMIVATSHIFLRIWVKTCTKHRYVLWITESLTSRCKRWPRRWLQDKFIYSIINSIFIISRLIWKNSVAIKSDIWSKTQKLHLFDPTWEASEAKWSKRYCTSRSSSVHSKKCLAGTKHEHSCHNTGYWAGFGRFYEVNTFLSSFCSRKGENCVVKPAKTYRITLCYDSYANVWYLLDNGYYPPIDKKFRCLVSTRQLLFARYFLLGRHKLAKKPKLLSCTTHVFNTRFFKKVKKFFSLELNSTESNLQVLKDWIQTIIPIPNLKYCLIDK